MKLQLVIRHEKELFSFCYTTQANTQHVLPVQTNFKTKISLNALTKLRLENLSKLQKAVINRPMKLQLVIRHEKELFSIKLKLIRNT